MPSQNIFRADKDGKNQKVQILRGLSVIAVILFHSFPSYFPNGYLGVDVFFLISGFVVTPSLQRILPARNINLKLPKKEILKNLSTFFLARFIRLNPTLAVVVIVTAAIAVFALPLGPTQQNVFSMGLAAITLSANFSAYKIQGDYFQPSQLPLLHTWSLSAEQQIYFVFPLIMIFLYSVKTRGRTLNFLRLYISLIIISGVIFICLSFFSHSGLAGSFPTLGTLIFYSPTTRFIEFLFGSILSTLTLSLNSAHQTKILPRVTFTFVFFAILIPFKFMNFPLLLVFALLLVCVSFYILSDSNYGTGSIAQLRMFRAIGDRSYSVYLWHLPILVFISEIPLLFNTGKVLVFLLSCIAIAVLSEFTFQILEKRYRDYLKRESLKGAITQTLLISLIMPLLILSFLSIASMNDYWKTSSKKVPPYANSIDRSCARDATNSNSPCTYVIGGDKEILLIGDSHAGAISQTLVNIAKIRNQKISVWTQGGCPAMTPFAKTVDYQKYSSFHISCKSHNLRVLNYVQNSDIDTVVISMRSGRLTNDGMPQEPFIKNFEDYIRLIQPFVNRIILVGPVPDFPEELYKRYFFTPEEGDMKVRIEEMPRATFIENPLWKSLAKGLKITFVDLVPLFCVETHCTHGDKYANFFTDGSHLNIYGAELLQVHLSEALR